MAANTRNDLTSSGILQEFLQRKFLSNFDPTLYFAQFAEAPMSDTTGYQTLRWAHFTTIAESSITTGTTSTDGVSPDDTSIAVTSVTTTPTQYRIVCSLSDMLLGTNPLPLLTKTAERVGVVMAQKLDSVIQTTVMAGSNVLYGGTATARTALAATDVLTTILLNKASTFLTNGSIPTFDGFYVAVVHPFCVYDLRNATAAGSWLDTAKYSAPEKIFRGEIGAMNQVRVVVSAHVNTFSSTATVYPTLVFGKEAYGVGYWQRPQVFVTDMVPSDSDPAAQRRKVSAKMAVGIVRLQEAAMIRIETGATSIVSQ